MTQSILSSLGSDQVNSIGDTVESNQVAEILRQTYFNMLGRYDLPEHNRIQQLTSSGDNTKPTLMFRPDGVHRIEWVKYFDSNPSDGSNTFDQFGSYSHDLNLDLEQTVGSWATTSTTSNTIGTGSKTFTVPAGLNISIGDSAVAYNGINALIGTVTSYASTTLVLNITSTLGTGTFTSWAIINASSVPIGPGYTDVKLLTVDQFFHMSNSFDPTDPNVGSYQLSVYEGNLGQSQNFTIYYKNDHQPRYYCIMANYYVLFDSFDNTQDTTLQPSKTESMVWVMPEWQMSDTFTPIMDAQQFPIMMADAKIMAFQELKQMPHPHAEQELMRQHVALQKWKAISGKLDYFSELPDYGRRGWGWW